MLRKKQSLCLEDWALLEILVSQTQFRKGQSCCNPTGSSQGALVMEFIRILKSDAECLTDVANMGAFTVSRNTYSASHTLSCYAAKRYVSEYATVSD